MAQRVGVDQSRISRIERGLGKPTRAFIVQYQLSKSQEEEWLHLLFGVTIQHQSDFLRETSIPIRRHVNVRNRANAYDPTWEMYFEQRQYNRVLMDLEDRPRLRHQWRVQQGICPVCGELITKGTGWHNHHIHWRLYGGSDDLDNRVLPHPDCHRQVHSPNYDGPPLRPSLGVRDVMLKRLAGKLAARAVLRGGDVGNVTFLPDHIPRKDM